MLSSSPTRYLRWVNCVDYERVRRPSSKHIWSLLQDSSSKSLRSGIKEDHTANYFSHGNAEATKIRDSLAEDSLEMLIQWLKDGGNVGIHGRFTSYSLDIIPLKR